jgi:molybdopterin-guanine dinucleotide biosynthesis protein A
MLSHTQPKETSLEEENNLGFSIVSYLTLMEKLFPGILTQLSIGNGNPPEATAEHKHYTTHDRLFHLPFGVAKTKASPLTEFTSYCQRINEALAKKAYQPIFKNLRNAVKAITPQLALATIEQAINLQKMVVTQLLTEPYIQKLKQLLQETAPNQATAERTEKAMHRAIFFRALSYSFEKKPRSAVKEINEIKNKQTFLTQTCATECDTADDILAAMLANTQKRIVAQLQTNNLANIFSGDVKTSNKPTKTSADSSDDSLESIRESLESSLESVESYLQSIATEETSTAPTEAPKLNFNHFSNHINSLLSQIERMKLRYDYIINPSLAMNLFLNHYIAIAKYFQKHPEYVHEIKLATTAVIQFIQSHLAEIKDNEKNSLTSIYAINTFKKINTPEDRKLLTALNEQVQATLTKNRKNSPKKPHPTIRPPLTKKSTVAKLGVFKQPPEPPAKTAPLKPLKSSLKT